MEIKDLAEVNAELQEKKERQDTVDFKMVTFSLSGKDYGVDIMNIKEIAKADKFTYVPNASGFVRGVYNLRGDIIPIIDLRLFFHLPIERRDEVLENMLIIHIEDRVYGTIVDKIDKVVGVNSQSIQPPHPIFGDINIKYISGVVEQHGDLYIILDVVRIFSQNQGEPDDSQRVISEDQSAYYANNSENSAGAPQSGFSDNDLAFIKDGLAALKKFYAGPLNEKWITERLNEWGKSRSMSNIQLKNAGDAEEFLSGFYSPHTGKFWTDEYAYALKNILPEVLSNNIQVWNPGCGKGYETFSLACILKLRYPDGRIKIWANDSDILSISNAPNMVFDIESVPEYCRTFLVKGRNGYTFNTMIKDSIVFEYHDVTNPNTLPDLDVVVARDTVSFLSAKNQDDFIVEITEKLKKNGVVVLGKNESMPSSGWKSVGKDGISAFVKA
ncbi:MAG: chemotaxis protein CheW [Spirochaetaceae bacterium]|jgi:purine-binding chemotaxis protein CheW|nr:chemotaxis protein CheW [Spirochaetaceae bacterium]